jgi:hypothetical protein
MANVAQIERPATRDETYAVPRDGVRILDVPACRFVMVDGEGPPREEAFAARLPGLYGTAYGVRFALKRRGIVVHVGPLEGLWTLGDEPLLETVFGENRDEWRWTLMIALPEEATPEEIDQHARNAATKLDPAIAETLRVGLFDEGLVAQLLHVGSYSEERASVERLHFAIQEAGFRPRGRHHEIYLGDPRRARPDRLRTILRQPVEEISGE